MIVFYDSITLMFIEIFELKEYFNIEFSVIF